MMSRSLTLWLLLLIILAGIGLRSYHLTGRSLWFDEAFSWRLIRFPLPEMMNRAAADVHPPLYYLLLREWATVFGTSLLSLRSFSVTLGAGAIAAGYLFAASAWRSRAVGLTAALFLSVSSWEIPFAWEARMYTLGMVLALLSSWLLLKAVRQKKQQPWWWIAYGVIAAAFAYTHYFAFLSLAAQALFVLGYLVATTRGRIGEILQWRLTWYAVLGAVVALVLYLPWLPIFLKQNAQVQANFWIPRVGGWSIPDTFYRMFLPTAGIPPHPWPNLLLTLLPLVLITCLWLLTALRCDTATSTTGKKQRFPCDAAWLTALGGLGPLVFSIIISFVGQSLYQDRYLIFAHLFIVTMIAVFVSRLSWPGLRRLLIIVLTIGSLVSYVHYWRELDIIHKPGAHAAARLVYTSHQNNEPVLVSSPFIFFAIDHYAREEFSSTSNSESNGDNQSIPHLYSTSHELLHFAGGPILKPEDIVGPDFLTKTPSKTIWMIDTTGFGGSEVQLPKEWEKVEHQSFPEVYGYQGEVIVNKYVR